MKNLVSILLICLCNIGFAQRGRIAIIDSEFILSKMPEYEEANNELKKRAAEWDAVIERKKKEIKDLKDRLSVERPLLTQQLIEEKEEDIQIIEKELLEFQQEKFGKDGDYFKQKLNLAKPLQDQITTIVSEIASKKKYTAVMDKATSSEAALMYVNTSDEISDQVIRKLDLTRNKSKLSKKEIQQLEIAERQAEVKDRQRTKRDELEERQRLLEQEKEQQALADNSSENSNNNTAPQESAEDKRKREQLEKIEKAKAERERIREEKLKEIEKRKAEILKKQEEARLAREKAREDALKQKEELANGKAPETSTQSKPLSERAQQIKAQQEMRRKEAADKKAKALEERKRLIEERKQKMEEEKQKRLKELEERKKGA